jgi:hypothetical protein
VELSAYLLLATGLHGVYKNNFIIRDLRFSGKCSCSRLDVGCLAADVSKYHSTTSIFRVKEFQIAYGRITIVANVCNYLPNVAANTPTTRNLCPQVPAHSQHWAQSQLATDTPLYPAAVSRMTGQCTARCHVSRAITCCDSLIQNLPTRH